MKLNQWGANIRWPYDIPDITVDGVYGTWAIIGAVEKLQEETPMKSDDKNKIYLECGDPEPGVDI